MKSLRHAARKAYRTTDHWQLKQLLAAESRWKRKVTIATNKLADVRSEINRLAQDMANKSSGLASETDTKP